MPRTCPHFEAHEEYVIKATREAMVHTRWTRPNVNTSEP